MATNIALNKPATASSVVQPYTPSRAVNGSITPFSRWLSNTVPAWLCVNVGAQTWINEWKVKHMNTSTDWAVGWNDGLFFNSAFKLEGSNDNVNWVTIDSVDKNTLWEFSKVIKPVCYSYYRVYVTKGLVANPQVASIVELELYEALSSSCFLAAIASMDCSVLPSFNKYKKNYTLKAANNLSLVSLVASAEDPGATIRINNKAVASDTIQYIPLTVGTNPITIEVTAQIGGGKNVYTVIATRQDSNYLKTLEVKPGTLKPKFAKATNEYTIAVDAATSSISIIPTAESTRATITVNGVAVISGGASEPIALNNISNAIPVVVTVDGESRTYTLTVNRPASAYLLGLTAQSGDSEMTLSPAPFVKTTMGYTASVEQTVSSIRITPTAEDSSATIMVNGVAVISHQPSAPIALNAGVNTIPVVVSAGNITQNYSVTITRAVPAESAYLLGLTVQSGDNEMALSPSPFVKTTMGYSATVDANVASLTITPTAESATAVIAVKGTPVSSGQASAAIALALGENTIPVSVTAGGVTQTYTITVNRVDTSLSNLTGSLIPAGLFILSPSFLSTTLNYSASSAGKGAIKLTATASSAGSVIKINGTPVVSGVSSTVQLAIGSNIVLVTVTNSGISTTYQITINR